LASQVAALASALARREAAEIAQKADIAKQVNFFKPMFLSVT